MSLTLGLTGMDQATEVAIKIAFADANHRLNDAWRLVDDNEADYVIVDMDTMYGPMSWLRLHAAGKHVVALTAAERTQADYLLGKPFESDNLIRLLHQIADASHPPKASTEFSLATTAEQTVNRNNASAALATTADLPEDLSVVLAELASIPVETQQSTPTSSTTSSTRETESVDAVLARMNGDTPPISEPQLQQADPPSVPTSSSTSAPEPEPPTAPQAADQPLAEPVADIGIGPVLHRLDTEIATAQAATIVLTHISPEDSHAAVSNAAASKASAIADETTIDNFNHGAQPRDTRERRATPLPRSTAFADWLRPGTLNGYARYQKANGPELLLDFNKRVYYGPPTLKAISEYFVTPVAVRDFEEVDGKTWEDAIRPPSNAQPLLRLQWLGGLLAGGGRLLPGHAADGRYALDKWPETEREYPRHFRIATAMMKGPATIDEIAASSNVPKDEVVDFINANIATGYAREVGNTPNEPPTKPGGLLGRLRGR